MGTLTHPTQPAAFTHYACPRTRSRQALPGQATRGHTLGGAQLTFFFVIHFRTTFLFISTKLKGFSSSSSSESTSCTFLRATWDWKAIQEYHATQRTQANVPIHREAAAQ